MAVCRPDRGEAPVRVLGVMISDGPPRQGGLDEEELPLDGSEVAQIVVEQCLSL